MFSVCTGQIVITGGLGALGMMIATWLSRTRSSGLELCLLGRSAIPGAAARAAFFPQSAPSGSARPSRLHSEGAGREWGPVITLAKCDIGLRADAAVLAPVSGPLALKGILHAGGVLRVCYYLTSWFCVKVKSFGPCT